MTATRYKNAWMWVAVAAMAVVSLARVEGSVGSAAVYTNPVLQFLAGQQNADQIAAASRAAVAPSRLGAQAVAGIPA